MNERGSLHHFQPKVVCQNFSDYGWLNSEKFILLKDSDIQNFLEKEETKMLKEKLKVTSSVASVKAFLAATITS